MSSHQLTIVQLDLVNSSQSFEELFKKYDLGNETLRVFIKKIEEIVTPALNESTKNYNIDSNFTKIEMSMADGYRLIFEYPENAYKFVEIFCRLVKERNQKPGIKQWMFRFGAATAPDINYDPGDLNKFAGYAFLMVKELEAGASNGWLFVDDMTYNELSQDIQNKFSKDKQSFKNKHNESREAWGCQMLENYVQPIRPIIWTDDDNKQELIKILQDVFTEEELKTICENNTSKLKGNPYHAITGNTVDARYSSLVNHLIRKGLIDSFLDILCKDSEYFANLALRK